MDDDYTWVEGNDFCCLCSWWHIYQWQFEHAPVLCSACLADYIEKSTASSSSPQVFELNQS